MGDAVIDASALVDLLLGTEHGRGVSSALAAFAALHAPAHMDAEVLSALGRLHRGGRLTARQVTVRLDSLVRAPIERHEIAPLLTGAWRRRDRLGLVDALYAELFDVLGASLVTTDRRLAASVGVAPITP